MRAIICACFITCCLSCKKSNINSNTDDALFANNKIDATVSLVSGSNIHIISTGSKAAMYYGVGGGLFIDADGVHATDPAFSIDVLLTYPSTTGNYDLTCEYWKDGKSNSLAYTNWLASDPGSITFISLEAHYAKGSFNTTCKLNADSVSITGTFEGYVK